MTDWMTNMMAAVDLWAERNRLVPEIYSITDAEVRDLVRMEDEYEKSIADLASHINSADYRQALISNLTSADESTCQVAAHIILRSGSTDLEADLITRLLSRETLLFRKIDPVLRVCEPAIILTFLDKLLSEQKPWLLEAFSTTIGKNQLPGLVKHYIDHDKLVTKHHTVFNMLGLIGDRQYAPLILKEMEETANGVFLRQACADALLMLGMDDGIAFYRDALVNSTGDGTLAFRLGSFSAPDDIEFLQRVAKSAPDNEYLKGILTGIGLTGDFSCAQFLVGYLKHANVEVRQAASEALSRITGEWDVDSDDIDALESIWHEWLASNRENFEACVRYTNGHRFDVIDMATELLDTDTENRSVRHEALIVYSGLHLPFDENRYIIDQLEQAKAWVSGLSELDLAEGEWIRFGITVSS